MDPIGALLGGGGGLSFADSGDAISGGGGVNVGGISGSPLRARTIDTGAALILAAAVVVAVLLLRRR